MFDRISVLQREFPQARLTASDFTPIPPGPMTASANGNGNGTGNGSAASHNGSTSGMRTDADHEPAVV